MKCSIKDCTEDAKVNNKCWMHNMATYAELPYRKQEQIAHPVTEIIELPQPDLNVTDGEIDDAIESLRKENDFFVVAKGGMTMHLFVKDMKSISIWTIIACIFQLAVSLIKNKTTGDIK